MSNHNCRSIFCSRKKFKVFIAYCDMSKRAMGIPCKCSARIVLCGCHNALLLHSPYVCCYLLAPLCDAAGKTASRPKRCRSVNNRRKINSETQMRESHKMEKGSSIPPYQSQQANAKESETAIRL